MRKSIHLRRAVTSPGWKVSTTRWDKESRDDVLSLEGIVGLAVSGPVTVPIADVLEELGIQDLHLTDSEIMATELLSIGSVKSLRKLSLQNIEIFHEFIEALSDSLIVLELTGCTVSALGLSRLGVAIEELNLALCSFSERQVGPIDMQSVRIIDLSGSDIDDELLQRLLFSDRLSVISLLYTSVTLRAVRALELQFEQAEIWYEEAQKSEL